MMIDQTMATQLTVLSDREVEITRAFDAPRALVFAAITEPKYIRRWWGLRTSELVVCAVDLRVGGKWHYVSRMADGSEHGFSGEYREIDAPARLVSTEGYDPMPGRDYLVTLSLDEVDGKTHLRALLQYKSVEDRDGHLGSGMEGGMKETYQRLAELLSDIQQTGKGFTTSRSFDATPEQVWAAWTQPALLMRWWGPAEFTAPIIQIDLRVGGRYLFCMRSPEGQDFYSTGIYQEIVPFERLVFTDSFADASGSVVPGSHYGMPDDFPLEQLTTITLAEMGGRTHMTIHQSSDLPEGMREMTEQGWSGSLDKLERALTTG